MDDVVLNVRVRKTMYFKNAGKSVKGTHLTHLGDIAVSGCQGVRDSRDSIVRVNENMHVQF